MQELIDLFLINRNLIFDFIKNDKFVFPKKFIENIDDLHDDKFYDSLKNKNNVLSFLFKNEDIKIFSVEYINEIFYFKSDIEYDMLFLFFDDNNLVYLNDKKIKNISYLQCNSKDDIYINGIFLKICLIKKNIFAFDDLTIPYRENNIFNKMKKAKYEIKNTFLKNF